MNRKNLIPVRRLNLKRRQAAARRWIAVDGLYLATLLAVGAVYIFNGAGPDHAVRASSATEIARSTTELATLLQQSSALKTNLQSVQEVSDPPDWSILLAVLSQKMGDDVVLDAVDCSPVPAVTSTAASVGHSPQTFRLRGIGRSQQAVTRFVLRLEALNFFGRVQLVQTAARQLNGQDGVGFELVCSLSSDGGVAR